MKDKNASFIFWTFSWLNYDFLKKLEMKNLSPELSRPRFLPRILLSCSKARRILNRVDRHPLFQKQNRLFDQNRLLCLLRRSKIKFIREKLIDKKYLKNKIVRVFLVIGKIITRKLATSEMQKKKKKYSHPRFFEAKVGNMKASQDSRALELFFSVLYSFLALLFEVSKKLISKIFCRLTGRLTTESKVTN